MCLEIRGLGKNQRVAGSKGNMRKHLFLLTAYTTHFVLRLKITSTTEKH